MERRPSLIGRDRTLADKVLGWAHAELSTRGEHTAVVETPRGGSFEVKIAGAGERPTHVFTVTVELDRLESDPPKTEADLLPATANPLTYALGELMSQLSEECWAAGWQSGAQTDIWALLCGHRTTWGQGSFEEHAPLLAAIDQLACLTGTWMVWSDTDGAARPVKLDDWRRFYEAHRK